MIKPVESMASTSLNLQAPPARAPDADLGSRGHLPERAHQAQYIQNHKATASPPYRQQMHAEVAVAALVALGHAVRLEVWRLLVPYGPLGLPAGEISARLAMPASSLSFHLQQMTHGRVLVRRRRGRQIIYAVNNEVIRSLCDLLANHGRLVDPPPLLLMATSQTP